MSDDAYTYSGIEAIMASLDEDDDQVNPPEMPVSEEDQEEEIDLD